MKRACLVVLAIIYCCAALDQQCSPQDGPLPDPEDCSFYLECQDGFLVSMTCPQGLHFNNIEKVCDFPHRAGCAKVDLRCPSGDEGNVTLLPHPTNCSLYLECDNGNIDVMECPPGLEFNPKLLVCDFPWESGCEAKDNQHEVEFEVWADPRCPSGDEGNVTLLPHPTNCSLYLECDNGNVTVMECPPGLEFNPDLLVCDFPWESGCKSEDNVVFEFRNDPRCPSGDEGNVTLIPHPTNCSLYLECDNGDLTVMECPPGLEFNPKLLVCDFPWESGCEAKDHQPEVEFEVWADPRCPSGDEGNVTLLPHPTNCSLYLECDNGNVTVMECPPGLEFNPKLLVCDFPWESGCEAKDHQPEMEFEVWADPRCPAGDEGNVTLLPHPTNCSLYLECDNGNVTVMECPPGLEFNPDLLVCDFPWESGCKAQGRRREPVCPNPGEGGGDILLFPKPSNCNQYYQCDNGNLLTMTCPKGLEFNPAKLVCDHPWAAKCSSSKDL